MRAGCDDGAVVDSKCTGVAIDSTKGIELRAPFVRFDGDCAAIDFNNTVRARIVNGMAAAVKGYSFDLAVVYDDGTLAILDGGLLVVASVGSWCFGLDLAAVDGNFGSSAFVEDSCAWRIDMAAIDYKVG